MTQPVISADDFEAMRHAMVASQLRTTGVDDPRVVAAMARVPRERFVPDAMRLVSYRDTALPIGEGRMLNAPMATGRLLTAAWIAPGDRVLLIGAATGYTAAVLAELAREVVGVEQDKALTAIGRDALAGAANVITIEGSLAEGAPDAAPFDVILIDGAVEQVPDALAAQLRPGGRIVSGLADRGVTRLAAGTATAHGASLTPFADAEVALLPGFARAKSFTF